MLAGVDNVERQLDAVQGKIAWVVVKEIENDLKELSTNVSTTNNYLLSLFTSSSFLTKDFFLIKTFFG